MNTLHLNSEKGWRGGEQQLAYLIKETESQGISNFVICRKSSALEKYCQQQHIPHRSSNLSSGIDLRGASLIKNICRARHIDVVHVHGSKVHTLAVLSVLLGNSTPIVLSRRVAFPVRQNVLTRWKYNHPSVKKIICISKAVRQVVRQSVARPERLTVVYSGIDIKRFQTATGYLRRTYAIPENARIIGNVAALSASKGLVTFVDTAQVFRSFNIPAHFVIVGEGK